MAKIPEIVHESWHQYLQPLFDDHKMDMLNKDILLTTPFYPEAQHIFRVFAMPLDKIKVVILGQDPYSRGEAIGFSFAVSEKTKIPASLQIIKKEIIESRVERDTSVNIESDKWKTLQHWRQQGVFLLNAALTVERLNPDSHVGFWNWFTTAVIRVISAEVAPIWMLWGSKARAFESVMKGKILKGNHPAAETYPNSTYKFTGCNHFNLCNKILKEEGKTIINW